MKYLAVVQENKILKMIDNVVKQWKYNVNTEIISVFLTKQSLFEINFCKKKFQKEYISFLKTSTHIFGLSYDISVQCLFALSFWNSNTNENIFFFLTKFHIWVVWSCSHALFIYIFKNVKLNWSEKALES